MQERLETTSGHARHDYVTCQQCGLELDTTFSSCPNDGTPVVPDLDGNGNDEFELTERIGAGGMAVVYKARDKALRKTVALKLLQSSCMSPVVVRRFQLEAQALANLHHPHIVSVHKLGVAVNGQPYMVMDYIAGMPLSSCLQQFGKPSLPKALHILLQTCDGLAYVHSQGILHRDLKPGNIMLINAETEEPTVKLVDFGIAKMTDDAATHSLTQTGEIFGTVLYMSPEQARGGHVDQRSDIYSLGCVMYELVTGRPPFLGKSMVEIILKQVSEKHTSINGIAGAKYPQLLERIIDKSLAKAPADRYQTAQELESDLRKLARRQHQLRLPSPQDLSGAGAKIACAAVLCCILAGGGYFARNFIMSKQPAKIFVHPDYTPSPTSSPADDESDRAAQKKMDDQVASLADKFVKRGHRDETETGDAIGSTDRMALLEGTPFAKAAQSGADSDKESMAIRQDGTTDLTSLRSEIESHDPRTLWEFSANDSSVNDSIVRALLKAHLRTLSLCNSKITANGIADITLPSHVIGRELRTLHLDDMQRSNQDVARIAGLPQLKELSLGSCGLDDQSLQLLSKHEFQRLILTNNPKITDAGVRFLTKNRVPEIELNLSETSVTPAILSDIARLEGLQDLWLKGVPVRDSDLPMLEKLTSLRRLDLSHSLVTDAGLAKFRPPSLEKLVLQHTPVTTFGVTKFKNNCPDCKVLTATVRKRR